MNNFLVIIMSLLISASSYAKTQLEILGAEENKQNNLPFSEAVAFGDLLFLSGQIGMRPGESALVKGGVQAETRQTMLNIKRTLEKYGSSMNRIIKCTIFLGDMRQWADMNIAYLEALGDHRPARSALGANGLALNASVEIECIASR
ncbi:MAG: 2-iminobutanoate/2-iminopropanoate deaminase [Flavobacterium sp.]|jgi:2-iminobutanoate/2-iminopropanoate deaminase